MKRMTTLSILFLAMGASASPQTGQSPQAAKSIAPSTVPSAAQPPAPAVAADPASACGYVTNRQGETPASQDIFPVDITQIDGRSTPLQPENRFRTKPGTRVLTVTDAIPPNYLPAAAIAQIEKMKRQKEQRAYKKLEVEVQPGVIYAVGARLLRDRLDVDSIHNNVYWEPVVWDQRAQPCK